METRAQRGRIEELKRRLKFDEMFCVEAARLLGGLALLWKKQIDIEVIEDRQNFIHAICCEKEGDPFCDDIFCL